MQRKEQLNAPDGKQMEKMILLIIESSLEKFIYSSHAK